MHDEATAGVVPHLEVSFTLEIEAALPPTIVSRDPQPTRHAERDARAVLEGEVEALAARGDVLAHRDGSPCPRRNDKPVQQASANEHRNAGRDGQAPRGSESQRAGASPPTP